MMKRVFVYEYLSGGGPTADASLLAAGTAMRDAVVADLLGLADCAVGAATCAQASALPAGAAALQVQAGESALDFVARESSRHDLTWVIAPETDGLLAQFQRAVGASRWLGCELGAIELSTSKHATLQRLTAASIATPLDFATAAARWVVKPDDGAGAVATRVFADRSAARDEQARRQRAGEAVTLEPWVEGEALSVSLLCHAGGVAELLSVNRQAIGVDAGGQVSFDGVAVAVLAAADARRAAIARLADQVVRAIPGLRGFVGIDLVWHAERGPVLIEVNPRVTCAYVGLSAALDRNIAADLLAAHAEDSRHAVA